MEPFSVTLPIAIRSLVNSFRYRAAIASAAGVEPDSVEIPAGIQLRLTPWFPLAQVEDDSSRCPFPVNEWLFPSRCADVARNFNPLRYRPPFIVGTSASNPGPAHEVGEWAEVPGFVAELDFDGVHIWGRGAEILDPESGEWRMSDAVECGHLGRSIGFWLNCPDGGFRLRHVAMLSGEPEGQINMGLPPLSTYFRSVYSPAEAVRADAEAFRSTRALWPAAEPQQEEEMLTEAEMEQLSARTAAAMSSAITAAVTAAVAPAVTAAVAALQTELTGVRTELTSARTDLAARVAADREAGFRTQLNQHVTSGRIAPAEVDLTVQSLMALPAEGASNLLAAIGARRVSPIASVPLVIRCGTAATEVQAPPGVDAEALQSAVDLTQDLPEGAAGELLLRERVLSQLAKRISS